MKKGVGEEVAEGVGEEEVVGPEEIVKAMFAGLAGAAASRQVAAAVAAAVLRTLFVPKGVAAGWERERAGGEENARLEAVRPVVRAALRGNSATGAQRAARNVALHHWSVDFRSIPAKEYTKVQREGCGRKPGGHRGPPPTDGPASRGCSGDGSVPGGGCTEER